MNKFSTSALVALLTAASAVAATTVSESFGYSSGASLGAGGSGFAGGWTSVVANGPGTITSGAASLSAGALATSGGSAVLSAAKNAGNDGSISVTRTLATPL